MQQNCEVPWPFLTGEVCEVSENGNCWDFSRTAHLFEL